MRQTLFRIALNDPWAFWETDRVTGLPLVGVGFIALVLALAWLGSMLWSSQGKWRAEHTRTTVGVAAALLLISLPGVAGFLPQRSLPIFGYGAMLLVGFLVALVVARRHAVLAGMDPDIMFDLGLWLLVSGIAGGRLAYLLQYPDTVFTDEHRNRLEGLAAVLAIFNLSRGGLVLIGAIFGGAIGHLAFCRRRKISFLKLADVIVPSIFIGMGFGRIGCLLNGCCFGDACTLPWAITFPPGSAPFDSLKERGFLDPHALASMPLHPTQIYSSIDGFLLAVVTAMYFRTRHRDGSVLAVGCVLYPITRFLIEFLRNDEMGQLGTGLTISQLYSIGIFVAGLALLGVLSRRPLELPSGAP